MLKRSVKGRRWNFWRSYSFVLTFICVLSVCLFSAFSVDVPSSSDEILPGEVEALDNARASGQIYAFYNGLLYHWNVVSWQPVSWVDNVNKKPSFTVDESQAQWQWFAEASGISLASSDGGGLTQAELDSSLSSFLSSFRAQITAAQPLTDFGKYFSVHDTFRQYLDADGQIKTIVSEAGIPAPYYLANMLNNALQGLNTNMNSGVSSLGQKSDYLASVLDTFSEQNREDITSGFSTNHQDLDALLSKLTAVNANVISFKNTNHTDLISGFSVNHQDLERVNKSLVGSGSASAVFWDSTTKAETTQGYTDVLSAIASLGSSMQNDLAKLRYVLASDKDIEIAEKQEPVKDAVSDSFAGDSSAAVKPDDVGNMADFSGNFQDAFNTGANAGDALGAVTSSDSWLFWSQEVANDLNRVPSTASDDEDDFIHFYDPSALDKYLSGGDRS